MSSKQEVIGNNYFEKNGFGISIYLSVCLSIYIYLSTYLPIYLSTYLPIYCLSTLKNKKSYQSTYPTIKHINQSINQSTNQSTNVTNAGMCASHEGKSCPHSEGSILSDLSIYLSIYLCIISIQANHIGLVCAKRLSVYVSIQGIDLSVCLSDLLLDLELIQYGQYSI